jgi:2,3-bisphosphoglycerate-independent phosphoglycerate mutase
VQDEIAFHREGYAARDFFFHVKKDDSHGEDCNFKEKSHRIEEFAALLRRITGLRPDVLVLTADHSTPELLKSLIKSPLCPR